MTYEYIKLSNTPHVSMELIDLIGGKNSFRPCTHENKKLKILIELLLHYH